MVNYGVVVLIMFDSSIFLVLRAVGCCGGILDRCSYPIAGYIHTTCVNSVHMVLVSPVQSLPQV